MTPTEQAADRVKALVEELRDPDYAREMQHLRSWSEIDRLFNEAADALTARDEGAGTMGRGEEFLEFKEALSDLRALRQEYRDLNGGGPGWAARWLSAWATVDELFANEDEAAWVRQQEDAHG